MACHCHAQGCKSMENELAGFSGTASDSTCPRAGSGMLTIEKTI